MARINKTGIPFCGLGLEKNEEAALKKILVERDMSAKRLLRYLVKQFLIQNTKTNEKSK